MYQTYIASLGRTALGRLRLAGDDGFELEDREDVLGSEVLGL